MTFYVKRWGLGIGRLHVCWQDLWRDEKGLEIVWGQRVLLSSGFSEASAQ